MEGPFVAVWNKKSDWEICVVRDGKYEPPDSSVCSLIKRVFGFNHDRFDVAGPAARCAEYLNTLTRLGKIAIRGYRYVYSKEREAS